MGDGEARIMRSKVVGVTWEGRQDVVRSLVRGQRLVPLYEEDNPWDVNAIRLFADDEQQCCVGFVKRDLAASLAEQRRNGWFYEFYVEEVTGGSEGKRSVGVNISIHAKKEE